MVDYKESDRNPKLLSYVLINVIAVVIILLFVQRCEGEKVILRANNLQEQVFTLEQQLVQARDSSQLFENITQLLSDSLNVLLTETNQLRRRIENAQAINQITNQNLNLWQNQYGLLQNNFINLMLERNQLSTDLSGNNRWLNRCRDSVLVLERQEGELAKMVKNYQQQLETQQVMIVSLEDALQNANQNNFNNLIASYKNQIEKKDEMIDNLNKEVVVTKMRTQNLTEKHEEELKRLDYKQLGLQKELEGDDFLFDALLMLIQDPAMKYRLVEKVKEPYQDAKISATAKRVKQINRKLGLYEKLKKAGRIVE